MTADLATLADRADGPRWQECSVSYALRILPEGPAAALRRALANDTVQHTEISAALRGYAIDIPGPSIGRHRLGRCRCGSAT
jgi:hypothetical protein